MDPATTPKIWKHLVAGKSLDGLRLERVNGLLDLRGIVAPAPAIGSAIASPRGHARELTNTVVMRGVSWKGLDLSNAKLAHLRFFDCVLEDCRFEAADCRDWRMWGTRIIGTSFRRADLRGAALGGVDVGRRNLFRQVDFSKAKLQGSVHQSSDMDECSFDGISGVDFQGTTFRNCSFLGELNDVLFYRHAFRGEAYPPNEMQGADFRGAKLHHVGFRGLDMLDVKWPNDRDHLIVPDYVPTLKRVAEALAMQTGEMSRRLGVLVAHALRWAGPKQREGVVNLRDWSEVCGEDAVANFASMVRAAATSG